MSELDFLKRKRREKAIEDVLFAYPSLIAPDLRFPRRQEVISRSSRTDLVFYFPKRVVVVEIKRGTAGAGALRQLERYLNEHADGGLKVEGILIAHAFNAACLKAQASSKWKPKPRCRRLISDVPLDIVICAECREARDRRFVTCTHDGCSDVLKAL